MDISSGIFTSSVSHQPAALSFSINRKKAFTLIEMLVVLVIIGIMAAMVLPKLSGLAKSHSMTVASQQVMDDVAYARQKALNDHATIFMVFIPPEYWLDNRINAAIARPQSYRQITNLITAQASTYALFSKREIGDQPGKPRARYLTGWRSLPDGVVFDTNKFEINLTRVDRPLTDLNDNNVPPRTFAVSNFLRADFPFPPNELTNNTPVQISLPYIAFDSMGRLVELDDQGRTIPVKEDVYLPLAMGSIIFPQDPATEAPIMQTPDILEKNYREPGRTNYTLVHIDRLTGRAKLERPELR